MRVEIKTRDLKNGSHSLYLEVNENGKRTCEALGLYLVPETDATAKRINENAMQKAITIKSKRMLGIDGPKDYVTSDILLTDWMNIYLRQLTPNVKDETLRHFRILVETIEQFLKKNHKTNIKVSEFGKQTYKNFLCYLKNDYRVKRGNNEYQISDVTLFNKQRQLNQMLNAAVRDGVLRENPFKLLDGNEKFKKVKTEREYLTVEEVQLMADTPTKSHAKEGFLFCCFTGLRLSDVKSLQWNDIQQTDSGWIVRLRSMKKTSRPVIVPLNANAMKWLPSKEGKGKWDKVFDLPERTTCRTVVRDMAKRAGIQKTVCWHTSRHTFATLSLTAGSDLYTVSKLLGHTSVTTTQIYGDVIMDKKMEALNLANGLFH